ncbi:MAG TPA: M48 family metallopeptidase [Terriglobales bacterium]|nr:M48 family metallopeptidase [Terriglobales bacterium]
MSASAVWAQTSQALQPQASAAEPTGTHYTLPPEKLEKAAALYHTQVVLFLAGSLYGFVVLLGFLRFDIGPRFRNVAERVTRFRFVQAYVFAPLILLTLAVLNLPFDIYGQHIDREYGISVQSWESWFWDWTKGQLVSYIILSFIIWLLYLIIRNSPRRWWFYFWLASLPIIVFIMFISPVILDPLFNKFEPLAPKNPELAAALHRVTERAGVEIPESRMFEMKASEKLTVYNAYVTGIGASKRIVVWDTTEHDMTIPETMFVFGHELGHYVLNHIWKGLAFAAVLMLVGLYIGFVIAGASVARWGDRLGIRALGDWASLPLLLLILTVGSFIGEPMGSAFSRHIEHQADIYGLEVTHGLVPHSSETAAVTFQKLGEKSFDYPYPNRLYVFWTYSHPAVADRLEFSLHYRPWDEGKANEFVK